MLLDSAQTKARSNLAKLKATKEFLEVMEKNGVQKPEDNLTEEQKELLAEDKYIEMRKKQYRK